MARQQIWTHKSSNAGKLGYAFFDGAFNKGCCRKHSRLFCRSDTNDEDKIASFIYSSSQKKFRAGLLSDALYGWIAFESNELRAEPGQPGMTRTTYLLLVV